MNDRIRHYTDERIDVSYDPLRCIHAEACIDGLPEVFDIARRPWILTSGASADAIAEVVAKCPSGALHFRRLDDGAQEVPPASTTIVPTLAGPLQVRGRVEVRSVDGALIVEDSRLTLCRCGLSQNKPFCDNSHIGSGFDLPRVMATEQTTNASAVTVIPGTSSSDCDLLDVAVRAGRGEPDALVYVFDNVFYDVYHWVYLATRDRRHAERVTRDALKRLPRLLRSGRYATLDQISDSLVDQARQHALARREADVSVGGMKTLGAGIRHLVLVTAASIAAASALFLAV